MSVLFSTLCAVCLLLRCLLHKRGFSFTWLFSGDGACTLGNTHCLLYRGLFSLPFTFSFSFSLFFPSSLLSSFPSSSLHPSVPLPVEFPAGKASPYFQLPCTEVLRSWGRLDRCCRMLELTAAWSAPAVSIYFCLRFAVHLSESTFRSPPCVAQPASGTFSSSLLNEPPLFAAVVIAFSMHVRPWEKR